MNESIDQALVRLESCSDTEVFSLGLSIVKTLDHKLVQQAAQTKEAYDRVCNTLKARGAWSPQQAKQVDNAARHIKKLRNAADYHKKRESLWAAIKQPALRNHPRLVNLGPKFLPLLQRLLRDCHWSTLLARALVDRYLQRSKTQPFGSLEPNIMASDIQRAVEGFKHFQDVEPTILDRIVHRDDAKIPFLVSGSVATLKSLIEEVSCNAISTSGLQHLPEMNVDQDYSGATSSEVSSSIPSARRSAKRKRKRNSESTPHSGLGYLGCMASELYTKTSATIQRLRAQHEDRVLEKGYMLISVSDLPSVDWRAVSSSLPASPTAYEQTAIAYREIRQNGFQGFARRPQKCTRKDLGRLLTLSSSNTLTSKNCAEWMQQKLETPPTKVLHYQISDTPKDGFWFDRILHPGERLLQRRKLPGINTSYRYLSFHECTPAGLHIEDANLASLNLVIAGAPKVWLIVSPKHRLRFETFLQDRFMVGQNPCAQFVRHQDCLVAPKELERAQISFNAVLQYPGQLVYTEPGAYHQVLNAGPNLAVAINWEEGGSDDAPAGYRWCQKACGKHLLDERQFRIAD